MRDASSVAPSPGSWVSCGLWTAWLARGPHRASGSPNPHCPCAGPPQESRADPRPSSSPEGGCGSRTRTSRWRHSQGIGFGEKSQSP